LPTALMMYGKSNIKCYILYSVKSGQDEVKRFFERRMKIYDREYYEFFYDIP